LYETVHVATSSIIFEPNKTFNAKNYTDDTF